MKIYYDSLFGILVICSLPFLLLLLIVAAVLTTRSKLKDTTRMRRNLQEGVYDQFLNNPKSKLVFRIMGGVGLIYSLGILVVLSLLMYSVGKAVGFDNWAYWLVIVMPFVCSFPLGLGIFWWILNKEKKSR